MNLEISEGVSGASERANGRASGPVLTSLFLFIPDHHAMVEYPQRLKIEVAGPCMSFHNIAEWPNASCRSSPEENSFVH